ncbi:hypothetical protein Ae201684P_007314 [Aphanomyces euteiches]|uniref:F-box domain-containing protein n=1 Tax=Aphanomyces euteiches TaxID=100861 RepID=A0A6G0W8M6_9STRA|nr:hypothetical protein Ae201684_017499 [Aphanomyces euteiches]KAH9101129.1 hypothetical protein Ae201684P_007314 [Aphanomyces euteiches]
MKSVWSTLPADLVIKIAFALPKANDLFALLEVLRPHINLGPLESLYRLSLTRNHSDLWPSLCLKPSILSSQEISTFQDVAQYYKNVQIKDFWSSDGVEWLKANLNPMATIQWKVQDSSVMADVGSDWSELRIHSLCFHLSGTYEFRWKPFLPQLRYLTSLEVHDGTSGLGDLLECIAENNTITDFRLKSKYSDLCDSDMVYLTKWFRHQPVRMFECDMCCWGSMDINVPQEFYQAMFNCPTLNRLVILWHHLSDIDFTYFNLTMKSLQMKNCSWSSDNIKTFASRLPTSKITHFELDGCDFGDDDGFDGLECLVQILPQTTIQWLKLTELSIDDSPQWCEWAQLFEKCPLYTLVIGVASFPSCFVQSLAAAIENNQTICVLELEHVAIANDDLHLLIQSMTASSRRVQTKQLILTSPQQEMNSSWVESLTKLAIQNGGQFVYRIT